MGNFNLCPPKKVWKSNFARTICESSGSMNPEHFADRIVKSLFKRTNENLYPVNLNEVGRILDVFAIEETDLDIETDAELFPNTRGYKVILNSKRSSFRKRYSCCHEFAHLLIIKYFSKVDIRKFRFNIDSKIDFLEEERLCQKIAARILLPSEQFTERAKEIMPSLTGIKQLSADFEASLSATVQRLIELRCWNFDILHGHTKDGVVDFHEVSRKCGLISQSLIDELIDSLFFIYPSMYYGYLNKKLNGVPIEIAQLSENNVAIFIWDRNNSYGYEQNCNN